MFFGAGNVIFPLALGVQTQKQCFYAFLGLFCTAIGGPLLGLLGATLYEGKCKAFFSRWGKIPRLFFMASTLALLGPFAVLPRCVSVSYASLVDFFPALPLSLFALLFCLISYICCFKKKWILPVLGNFLSPILLGCLLCIIYQGLQADLVLTPSSYTPLKAFNQGLSTGYDTMDLIASIYFSAGIWALVSIQSKDSKVNFKTTLKAGSLGCLLLALIYLGLSYSAAKYAPFLSTSAQEQLITKLAHLALGPFWGNLANIAVALACLTTVISLCMTLSKTISEEVFKGAISYSNTLILMLAITVITSNLGFRLLMKIIHPAVSIGYPFIIVLTLINIYEKWIKEPKPAS